MILSSKNKIFVSNQSIGELFGKVINDLSTINNVEVFVFTGNADCELNKNIFFIKSLKYNSKSNCLRVLTWIVYSIHLFLYLLFNGHRFNKIILVSNPPFSIVSALLYSSKISYIVYDVYPDVLNQMNIIKKTNFIYVFWAWLNKIAFFRVKNIITISFEMKKSIQSYIIPNQKYQNKINVVLPWFSSKSFRTSSHNPFCEVLNPDNNTIITYCGNMGITHPLEVLIEVAKDLASSKILFVFVGDGPKLKTLKNLSMGLCNVIFFPKQTHVDLQHILSISSFSVVALDVAASHSSLPSKLFSAIATETPILGICDPESSLSKFIVANGIGVTFDPSDIQGIYKFILEIDINSDYYSQMKCNAASIRPQYSSDNSIKMTNILIS